MNTKRYKSFVLAAFCLFIFVFMFWVTKRSYIQGDAYGYAMIGAQTNPFILAKLAYTSWSGRFFSELWGFTMCQHKYYHLWYFLNSLFFVIVFLTINLISNKEYNPLHMLVIFLLIFTIDGGIREQVYTWIMGTTYFIPLMLSLIYLLIIFNLYNNNDLLSRKTYKILLLLSNVLLFYACLCMENISVVMSFAVIVINIYFFIITKKINLYLFLNFIFSLSSSLMLLLSPGASGRLAEYHPEWMSLSLLEKLNFNIKYFIQLTFINNHTALIVFSILLLFIYLKKKSNNKYINFSIISILLISILFFIISIFKLYFIDYNNIFIKYICLFYWIIYIVACFYIEFTCLNKNKEFIIFLTILAGSSSLCMMISPIIGSRSLVYFAFFFIIIDALLLNEIYIPAKTYKILCFVLILCSLICCFKWYKTFSKISRDYYNQQSTIEYYRLNPNSEAYIPAIDNLHSGFIDESDTYHLDSFKQYYGIDKNTIIHFYMP